MTVRELRERLGVGGEPLSVRAFAIIAKVTDATVYNWEREDLEIKSPRINRDHRNRLARLARKAAKK